MIASTNSTAGFYRRSLDQLDSLRSSAEGLQTQIATGQRLTRGSDDPVAASRMRDLARQDRLANVDQTNASSASLSLETASSVTSDMTNLLIRARELAVAASSDTANAENREIFAVEIDELRQSMLDLANQTDQTGRPLFGGQNAAPAYVEDASGVVTYAGSIGGDTIEIGEGIAIERGVTGPNLFSFEVDGVPTDAFAFLANFTANLRGAAPDPGAAARDALGGFDNALDTMNRSQTVMGARLAWIDNVQFIALSQDGTRAQEYSDLGDTNLTEAITQLQQTLTVLEAGQASFVRLSSLSLFNSI